MVIPNIQVAHVNDEIDENPSHGKMIRQIVYKECDILWMVSLFMLFVSM